MEDWKREAIRQELEQEKIDVVGEINKIKYLINWHQNEIFRLRTKKNELYDNYHEILPSIEI